MEQNPIQNAINVILSFLGHGSKPSSSAQATPQPQNLDQQMTQRGWTVKPDGSYYRSDVPPSTPTSKPQVLATSTPSQPGDYNFQYNFNQYPQDLKAASIAGRGTFNPQQPPQSISDIIRKHFPNEATPAAMVAANENANYNPAPKDNPNTDGSIDRGLFSINSNSFNGLMQRQGNLLKNYGINSFNDMLDPDKNTYVARLIQQGSKQANPNTNGWGGWFGWQDNGYNLNNNLYGSPRRGQYESAKLRAQNK